MSAAYHSPFLYSSFKISFCLCFSGRVDKCSLCFSVKRCIDV
nr:MAG TPA: hypothetical protein [Caudoviricetes sp.]